MCRYLYTKKTNASIGKIRVINWCLLIVILESRTFQAISSSRCNLVELELCMHIFNVFINAIEIVRENGRAGSLLLHLVTASFIHSSRQRVMLGVSKPVPPPGYSCWLLPMWLDAVAQTLLCSPSQRHAKCLYNVMHVLLRKNGQIIIQMTWVLLRYHNLLALSLQIWWYSSQLELFQKAIFSLTISAHRKCWFSVRSIGKTDHYYQHVSAMAVISTH